MILIVAVVVFLVAALFEFALDDSVVAAVFCGLFFGAGAFGLMCLFVLGINADPSLDKTTVPREHKLAVLADHATGSVHGSFFLGIGSFGDDGPGYTFYGETKPNHYKLMTVDADNVDIVETTGTPKMVEHCHTHKVGAFKAWPFHPKRKVSCDSWDDVTFYVPPGSIKSGYKLDAN